MQVIRGPDGKIQKIKLRRFSNWHAHLRDKWVMEAIAHLLMKYVLYLLVMPNVPLIRTVDDAIAYYDRLMVIARRHGLAQVRLIMTVYHTADLDSDAIERIAKSSIVRAVKHYPPVKGATTNSGHSIPLDDPRADEQLHIMAENGVPLLGHFEDIVDEAGRPLDPREGEAHYTTTKLWKIRDRHHRLKISFEHASTVEAIKFVKADTSGNTVLTATPHHGLCDHSDLARSWGQYLKCKPSLQTPENRAAIAEFITSGDPRAIHGDDSAAHLRKKKDPRSVSFTDAQNGSFWQRHSAPAVVHMFEKAGALDQRCENFLSLNGPAWWGEAPPAEDDLVTMVPDTENDIPNPVQVPEEDDEVVAVGWSVEPDRMRIGYSMESAPRF